MYYQMMVPERNIDEDPPDFAMCGVWEAADVIQNNFNVDDLFKLVKDLYTAKTLVKNVIINMCRSGGLNLTSLYKTARNY